MYNNVHTYVCTHLQVTYVCKPNISYKSCLHGYWFMTAVNLAPYFRQTLYSFMAQGSDSGPFGTACVNTISKEMGPFSASGEWNEWINFHSKWVSYQHGHSIWVHSAKISHSIWVIFSPFNMGHLQHKYSLTTMRWEFFSFRRYF